MTAEPLLSFDRPPSLLRYDDGAKKLEMRPSRAEDAEELLTLIEASLPSLRGFMPWAFGPIRLDHQRERLGALDAGFGKGGDIVFHLRHEEGGPILGCLGLHRARVMNPLGFEVGYWIGQAFAGQGLATLATRCAVMLGLECFDAVRIQCGYNEANRASEAVCRKVGFREEGRLRYFQAMPTEAMREQGCLLQPMNVISALFPDDRPTFDWYAKVGEALHIFGPDGELVWSAEARDEAHRLGHGEG